MAKSSWKGVAKWYDKIVSDEGHYYHQNIILPKILDLLRVDSKSRLVDLACGQGILSRHLPKEIDYLGIDVALPLINEAKKRAISQKHQFETFDLTKVYKKKFTPFSHATIILALQNTDNPLAFFKNAAHLLEPGAPLIIVLNHPCFRIPRQTSWGFDDHLQYRKINRYLSPIKIPIKMHPSKKDSPVTYSYHYSLTDLSKYLCEAGFAISRIEEWCSDKKSYGKKAKTENLSRREIPLFMTLIAKKMMQ